MKKISIIIPVFFNEDSLSFLFEKLQTIEEDLKKLDLKTELIFIDDGSGDNSLVRLLEFKTKCPETTIIKHSRNFGAMHAIKTGTKFVKGDCFTILSADLQDPPSLIIEMVNHWLNGAKYVICRRQKREDPFSTRLFARIYYFLLRLFVVPNYPSGGFDLALMDKDMLPYLQNSGKNINISLFAFSLGYNPVIIPYNREKRIFGKSRWTFRKKVSFFIDSLLGFSIIPIRIISILGIIISTLSIGYGVFVFFLALVTNIPVQGFATLAILISFLMGLIIIMLGIIGEYVWRIFDEVNGRPESVIETVY